MNDAAVQALWLALGRLRSRVERLEQWQLMTEARIRARLKEEAQDRDQRIAHVP